MNIFDSIITQPFAALLKALYQFTGSYGLAIILFALVVKIVLLYFSARGKKAMMQTQRIQPKLKELQTQYKNDKVKYNEAVQKVYREENVSMTGGCLWSLLPFPILIALYGVIQRPFANLMGLAQEQITKIGEYLTNLAGVTLDPNAAYYQLSLSNLLHEHFGAVQSAFPDVADKLLDINYNFLGLNLAQTPGLNALVVIPLLSGATAFLSFWLSQKMMKNPAAQGSGKMMIYFSLGISVYFGFVLPALMGVYWISQNVFTAIQDIFLTKHYQKIMAAEDAKRAELAARRKAAEDAMKEELRQRRAEEIEAKKAKRKPGQTIYKMQNKPKPKKPDAE